MSPLSWRCQILLLLLYHIYWLFNPVCCNTYNSLGSLRVEPPVPFLMGSNLTLYCHIDNCTHLSHIYLQIQDEKVLPWKFVNCTAIFSLINFQKPESNVFCKKQDPGEDYIVTGITLRSGLPPHKAHNISCETTRNATFIDCKWKKGKETHVPTIYDISVKTESGSLVYSHQFKERENCSIPREHLDVNVKYQLFIAAHNVFGQMLSEPFSFSLDDVVIPETPQITHIDFSNKSLSAFLQWKTSESTGNLKPKIRIRASKGHWVEGEVSELGEGLVEVAGLKPLTDYEFQVKTCSRSVQQTDAALRSANKIVCSRWSLSVWKKTPGKGPSQPVFVWRDSVMTMTNKQRMVTVFWKPPPADDYSGDIHLYEIFVGDGQKQLKICTALSNCSARVPLLQPVTITAVTSYGTSPPATVPLTLSDAPGPVWELLTAALDGSSVTVTWACPEHNDEVLNYVIERTTVPPSAMHWQTVPSRRRDATVTGLEAGVRYNISIYAVTTRGVSAPSSSVVYSKELKPVRGPFMSVLVHEPKRVLVQWDELLVEERRGFITSYTIYYWVLNSSSSEHCVSIPVPGPMQRWLDCPTGALALQMSASTAAGEGPKSNLISSHPPAPPVGLVIIIIFIITFFIAIIINLMCWKCVRKRIKQKCIAWGPEWLVDNQLQPKNSNAVKLLQLDRSEPCLFSSYDDPPLSPINFLTQDEREELYPCVHVEVGSVRPDLTLVAQSPVDSFHCDVTRNDSDYKPQTNNAFSFAEKEDTKDMEEETTSSDLSGGFIEGFLSNVQVDLSDGQKGPGLDSVNCSWWSNTHIDMTEKKTRIEKVDNILDALLTDSEGSADDALLLFSDNNEGILAAGYFPQLFSPVSST